MNEIVFADGKKSLIFKYNKNHDAKGRFSSANSTASNADIYLHSTKAVFDKFKPAGDGFVYFSRKDNDEITQAELFFNANAERHPKAPKDRLISATLDHSKLKTFDPFTDKEAKEIAEKHGLPADRSYVKWDELANISEDMRSKGYSMVQVQEPFGGFSYAVSNMDAIKIQGVKEWE